MKITPSNITTLADNEVFVFGSNEMGQHHCGAALLAHQKFGAVMGQAKGHQGQSYAIVTIDFERGTLPLSEIEQQLDELFDYALAHPSLEFLLTAIGTGIAGFTTDEIASCVRGKTVPPNVSLPAKFIESLEMGT